jgi:hypothetical protein
VANYYYLRLIEVLANPLHERDSVVAHMLEVEINGRFRISTIGATGATLIPVHNCEVRFQRPSGTRHEGYDLSRATVYE